MKTLTSIFISAALAGSALLQAQETAPPPDPSATIVEEAAAPSAIVAEPEASETTVATTPQAAETMGPPAPSADAAKENSNNTVEYQYEVNVSAPERSVESGTVTYDGGKFTYKVERKGSNNSYSFDGSFLQGYWFSPFMFLFRSGLLILWVALGCATAAIFQPAIARTQVELRQSPGRSAALGFLWLLSFWILILFGIVLAIVLIGLPFILVVIVFDLALRVFGLTVTFAVVGEWVARKLNRPGVSIYAAVFIGACVLGLLRIVPIVGSFIWFAAALFGVGAALATRFGTAMNPPAIGYSMPPPPPAPMAPAAA